MTTIHTTPLRPLIEQATRVLAAIGEAGYPIAGNGAPDYDRAWGQILVRGAER